MTRTPDLAISDLGTTRSAAAVDLWGTGWPVRWWRLEMRPRHCFDCWKFMADGGAAACGDYRLSCGFVGAAESKQALAEFGPTGHQRFSVHGTRGGSAMASSVVNAAALLAANDTSQEA